MELSRLFRQITNILTLIFDVQCSFLVNRTWISPVKQLEMMDFPPHFPPTESRSLLTFLDEKTVVAFLCDQGILYLIMYYLMVIATIPLLDGLVHGSSILEGAVPVRKFVAQEINDKTPTKYKSHFLRPDKNIYNTVMPYSHFVKLVPGQKVTTTVS